MSTSAISSASPLYVNPTAVLDTAGTVTPSQSSFAQVLQHTSSGDAAQTNAMQQWKEEEWKVYLYLPSPGSMLQYMQENQGQASDMQKWSQQQWVDYAYSRRSQDLDIVASQHQESVAVASANAEPAVTEASISAQASSASSDLQTDIPMQQWDSDTWKAYLYLPSPGSMLQYMQENQKLSAAMGKWSQQQWVDYAYNLTSLNRGKLIQA